MSLRRAALLVAVALTGAGCGEDPVAPVSLSCTDEPAAITKALAAAPGPVRLDDGSSISDCVLNARSDAALQNVGVAFSNAAEDLEERALGGDAEAGLQLGYLVGAATKGAETTSGVSAELIRRLERSADLSGVAPEVDAALERGLGAGTARG